MFDPSKTGLAFQILELFTRDSVQKNDVLKKFLEPIADAAAKTVSNALSTCRTTLTE